MRMSLHFEDNSIMDQSIAVDAARRQIIDLLHATKKSCEVLGGCPDWLGSFRYVYYYYLGSFAIQNLSTKLCT